MSLLNDVLTVILVLDCLFLILLILVQLPKKEAGLGQAFGGGATDALFGPGSGNVLTQLTQWAAGIFLGLGLLLSILYKSERADKGLNLKSGSTNQPAAPSQPTPPPPVPDTNTTPSSTNTPPAANQSSTATNIPLATNQPAPPVTNTSPPTTTNTPPKKEEK